ncbi:MAG: hypothetical protein CMM67_09915 [Rhodospirillaceae bacterium]|nr:hypothetical protein [Rhodospirillaceae bacterium]OUT77034.1 MAG: hypothetical protein CBB83_10095 [Rhodospirillaceae bacterium TMED23]
MAVGVFSSSALIGALSGGVTNITRALVGQSGQAQNTAANSIDRIFARRISEATAELTSNRSSPETDKLLLNRANIINRRERVTNSIAVVNKALGQMSFLKNHVTFLREQLTGLEAGTLSASDVAVEWDNKLRKINNLAFDASEFFKTEGLTTQLNLIDSGSRTNFQADTLVAPFNTTGDTLEVKGGYLGTDYFITENASADLLHSDTAYLATEAAVGAVTQQVNTSQFIDEDATLKNNSSTAQVISRAAFAEASQNAAENADIINPTGTKWVSISGELKNDDTSSFPGDTYRIFVHAGETLTVDIDKGFTDAGIASFGDSVDTRVIFRTDSINGGSNTFILSDSVGGLSDEATTSTNALDTSTASSGSDGTFGGSEFLSSSSNDPHFSIVITTSHAQTSSNSELGSVILKVRAESASQSDPFGTYTLNIGITPTNDSTGLGGTNLVDLGTLPVTGMTVSADGLVNNRSTGAATTGFDPTTGAITFEVSGFATAQTISETSRSNDTTATAQIVPRSAFQVSSTDQVSSSISDKPRVALSGTLTSGSDAADIYEFQAKEGEAYQFDIDGGFGAGSDSVDTKLTFIDTDGTEYTSLTSNTASGGSGSGTGSVGTTTDADGGGDTLTLINSRDPLISMGTSLGLDSSGNRSPSTFTASSEGTFYVKVESIDSAESLGRSDFTLDTVSGDSTGNQTGDYTLNVSVKKVSEKSSGLGNLFHGAVTGGGQALLDAWVYKNFNNATSITQAKAALDVAESKILLAESDLVNDRNTLRSRASLFQEQIDGISSEVQNLVEEIQDAARAKVLARQLEFTIAQFDFTLLAARSSTLVQSLLISGDSQSSVLNVNASRTLINIGQNTNISA